MDDLTVCVGRGAEESALVVARAQLNSVGLSLNVSKSAIWYADNGPPTSGALRDMWVRTGSRGGLLVCGAPMGGRGRQGEEHFSMGDLARLAPVGGASWTDKRPGSHLRPSVCIWAG